jgi:ABC-type bacteriocin/lantibiotic exporter with double-glycine peptidase domain
MILFIIIGGRMVITNFITIGTFVAFLTHLEMFFSPITQISMLYAEYKSSTPAIKSSTPTIGG